MRKSFGTFRLAKFECFSIQGMYAETLGLDDLVNVKITTPLSIKPIIDIKKGWAIQ